MSLNRKFRPTIFLTVNYALERLAAWCDIVVSITPDRPTGLAACFRLSPAQLTGSNTA
jgi:hypothetical protein